VFVDVPETDARMRSTVGVILKNNSKYTEAEPLFKRAPAIREKALGKDHLDVAQSLENLAKLYRKLDRIKDAEPLEERALIDGLRCSIPAWFFRSSACKNRFTGPCARPSSSWIRRIDGHRRVRSCGLCEV